MATAGGTGHPKTVPIGNFARRVLRSWLTVSLVATTLAIGNVAAVPVATPAIAATAVGIDWTARSSAADNQWFSVAHGDGLFVAVAQTGTGNRVMTSPDGITWTAQVSAADTSWHSVAYGDGLFVAVALSGQVMTSPDGITWISRTGSGGFWRSVAYGDGLFVAVSLLGPVMTSPDGIIWTPQTGSASGLWYSVTHGNGLFVAVSHGTGVMTSPDGITWTAQTGVAGNQWMSVVFGNGLFVAVSQGTTGSPGNRVMTSPNGIAWTERLPAADTSWQSVAFGDGMFVAVSLGPDGRVMTSPDGISWTLQTPAAGNNWQSVTFGNGQFVAVSSSGVGNRVMTSRAVPDEEPPPAQGAVSVVGKPAIHLDLQAKAGDVVGGSPILIEGQGLKPDSTYSLVMRSTPVNLKTGIINNRGTFGNTANLPSGLSAGTHTITLTATGLDGSTLSLVTTFVVSGSGTFTSISPGVGRVVSALATTGPSSSELSFGMSSSLVLLVLGIALFVLSRRNSSPRLSGRKFSTSARKL